MKVFLTLGLVAFALPMFAAVCQADAQDTAQSSVQPASSAILADNQGDEETEIAANLAKLSPEDRKLAEAQKFCPIMVNNRLGSMGAPAKFMVKGQPVFVCCKGCGRKALAKPDATLAKVAELKAKYGR